jgi:hypothetical protein
MRLRNRSQSDISRARNENNKQSAGGRDSRPLLNKAKQQPIFEQDLSGGIIKKE